MIPGAKSCGSVGKLGDRADPEGATASNGDVRGGGERRLRRRGENRWTKGRRGRERGHKKGEEEEEGRQGSPFGREDRKTAIVFPSEVEEEDERDRSQKSDRQERGGRKGEVEPIRR